MTTARLLLLSLTVIVSVLPLSGTFAQSGGEATPEATTSVEALSKGLGPDGGARGINDDGDIVGWAGDYSAWVAGEGEIEGFLWTADETTWLGAVLPTDINAGDVIIGVESVLQDDETYIDTPFVYRDGAWEELPLLEEGVTAFPVAIADDGTIVGQADGLPVSWSPDGKIAVLNDLGGGGSATGINNDGTISGWSADSQGRSFAVTWVDGRVRFLDEPEGLVQSAAYAVNDDGTIVGYGYSDELGYQAIAWIDSEPEFLVTPDDKAYQSIAWSVGDGGHVAGVIWETDAEGYTAALWQDGKVTPLVALTGYSFSYVDDVNADGNVVGYAYEGEESVPTVWISSDNPSVHWMTGKSEEASPEAED